MPPLAHIRSMLVIEDEYLIAMELADMVKQNGVRRVQLVAEPKRALDLINSDPIDFATVDVNLRGTPCDELVVALVARSIPFVYVSGLRHVDRPQLPRAPWLTKPIQEADLIAAMLGLLRSQ